ncbi:hypothetical protein CEP54_002753 [Fusarium duplospermum]|uniref:Uncharacterized protein n=1 Tax=Fusarium duplospermum TaxID=1325734 RepID=A0A428QTW8_9HYPO|nr:hypothetical protein CEP54_002753 [Fusarium duplospermum]
MDMYHNTLPGESHSQTRPIIMATESLQTRPLSCTASSLATPCSGGNDEETPSEQPNNEARKIEQAPTDIDNGAQISQEKSNDNSQYISEKELKEESGSTVSSDHSEPDGLEFVEEAEVDDGGGVDCELHVYETRFDTRHDEITLRIGVKQEFEPPKERSHAAALVLIRSYDIDKELISTVLEVRSPHLRKALRKIIKSYPGVDFSTVGKVSLVDEDAWCLFHYRAELEAFANSSDDIGLRDHMVLCLQYMTRKFQKGIARFGATVEGRQANECLDFKNLWMVFRPGALLYQKSQDSETVTVLRFMELMAENEPNEHWSVCVKQVKCNGTQLGYVYKRVHIAKYDGIEPLSSLETFPLQFHPEKQRVEDQMKERGRKYLSLTCISHCQYRGTARLSQWDSPTTLPHALKQTVVRQRIMVDFQEFYQNLAGPNIAFADSDDILGPASADLSLSERDLMVCDYEVPGYTLISKRWGLFSVKDVQAVNLNEDAFDNLVLAAEKKQILSSLITTGNSDDTIIDDFIEGKEAMADYARRPLVAVNSGQFIGPSTWVEQRLGDLLRLATRWGAVLLLDEADVFMQARNLQDLERNGLVSVLLRILEYFEGILFLTTNRVETIDSAFMSRIHLALSYPPLCEAGKRKLWETWIIRSCQGQRPEWAEQQLLDHLSRLDVSGRDIKNVSTLAQALARSDHRDLVAEDILRGVSAMTQFQEEFKSITIDKKLDKKTENSGLLEEILLYSSWLKTSFTGWWSWQRQP